LIAGNAEGGVAGAFLGEIHRLAEEASAKGTPMGVVQLK
jgi:hypothetical protein